MRLIVLALAAATLATAWGAPGLGGHVDSDTSPTTDRYRGRTARQWYRLAVTRHNHARDLQRRLVARVLEVRSLRRSLRHRPSVDEALRLAAITYGVPLSELRAVAWCESRHRPTARHPGTSAGGLMQFLPSTWRRTPYRAENVFSAYANALAAGWLWRASGRSWRQWVCQP